MGDLIGIIVMKYCHALSVEDSNIFTFNCRQNHSKRSTIHKVENIVLKSGVLLPACLLSGVE